MFDSLPRSSSPSDSHLSQSAPSPLLAAIATLRYSLPQPNARLMRPARHQSPSPPPSMSRRVVLWRKAAHAGDEPLAFERIYPRRHPRRAMALLTLASPPWLGCVQSIQGFPVEGVQIRPHWAEISTPRDALAAEGSERPCCETKCSFADRALGSGQGRDEKNERAEHTGQPSSDHFEIKARIVHGSKEAQ